MMMINRGRMSTSCTAGPLSDRATHGAAVPLARVSRLLLQTMTVVT